VGGMQHFWPVAIVPTEILGGKRKEMTGTQHVETFKTLIYLLYYYKYCAVLFSLQNNVKLNHSVLHLCYLVATSNGSKSQLFPR
jgi:hypothetical protein